MHLLGSRKRQLRREFSPLLQHFPNSYLCSTQRLPGDVEQSKWKVPFWILNFDFMYLGKVQSFHWERIIFLNKHTMGRTFYMFNVFYLLISITVICFGDSGRLKICFLLFFVFVSRFLCWFGFCCVCPRMAPPLLFPPGESYTCSGSACCLLWPSHPLSRKRSSLQGGESARFRGSVCYCHSHSRARTWIFLIGTTLGEELGIRHPQTTLNH